MAAWVEATTREMGQSLINPDKPSVSASALPGDTGKPALGPKPHLMPKPFALQRNATVRPIRAPKNNFSRELNRAASSESLLNIKKPGAGGPKSLNSGSNGTVNGSNQIAALKPVPLGPKPDLLAKPKPEPTKSPGSNNQTGPNSKPGVTAEDVKDIQPRSRAKSLGSQDQKNLHQKVQGEAPKTEADVKVSSRCWPPRNRLSVELTSKFESPSQPEKEVRREAETSKMEKEWPPCSPSESKTSKLPVDTGELGDEDFSGGSIKRRISLLFDQSTAAQRRDTFNKRDNPAAEISVDIKQRIQNLSLDAPRTRLPSTGGPKSPPSEKTQSTSDETPDERSSEKAAATEKVPVDKPPSMTEIKNSAASVENVEEEDHEDEEEDYVPVPVYRRVGMSLDAETKRKEEEEIQRKDEQLEKERQQRERERLLEEERKAREVERQKEEERKRAEEERKQEEEKQRQMEERRKQEEERKRRVEEERKEEERRRQAEEEKRRIEEEKERLREEERLKKEREMEEERSRIQELERQKEKERLRQKQEREERLMKEREREERKRMEEERLKEEERLRQKREKERLKKEKEMEEERKRIQELERQKEEERLKQEREKERLKKEKEMEEERKRIQELEKQREEERLRKEREIERIQKEKEMEEERRRIQELERQKEEERLRKEREKEERLKKQREMEERIRMEEERLKEEERLRQEREMERLKKEKEMEEERQRIQEMERQKEEKRLKQEREKERVQKEKEMEEERRSIQELEKQREEERLRKEREIERIRKEKEIEEERRRIQELERQKEEERLRQERELERIKKEKEMEEERQRIQRQKEEERLRQEREKERLRKEREIEERKRMEEERQREEERLRQERERERLKKEKEMEEERRRIQEMERLKEEEKPRREHEMEMETCKATERLREEVPTSYDLISFDAEEPAASQTLVSTVQAAGVSPRLTEVVYDDFSVKPRRWGTRARRSSTPSPSREPPAAPDHSLQPESKSSDPGPQEPSGDQAYVHDLIGFEPEASSPQNSTESRTHTYLEDLLEPETDEGQLKDGEPEEDGVAEQDTENLIEENDEQSENNDTVDDNTTQIRINQALQRLTRRRNTSTDSDTAAIPVQEEPEPLPVLESAAPLLDSSVFRSRVDLGKKRSIKRSRPSRAVRQRAALPALTEGSQPDWRFCDSTEAKDRCSNGADSESEEEPSRDVMSSPAPSQPKRVPVFPGMDPSALMAQLKRRGGVIETESPTEAQTPPSVPSRSPRTPTMALGPRVLPPVDAKDSGSGSSPSWLLELKSKKRMSQPESEA